MPPQACERCHPFGCSARLSGEGVPVIVRDVYISLVINELPRLVRMESTMQHSVAMLILCVDYGVDRPRPYFPIERRPKAPGIIAKRAPAALYLCFAVLSSRAAVRWKTLSEREQRPGVSGEIRDDSSGCRRRWSPPSQGTAPHKLLSGRGWAEIYRFALEHNQPRAVCLSGIWHQ